MGYHILLFTKQTISGLELGKKNNKSSKKNFKNIALIILYIAPKSMMASQGYIEIEISKASSMIYTTY